MFSCFHSDIFSSISLASNEFTNYYQFNKILSFIFPQNMKYGKKDFRLCHDQQNCSKFYEILKRIKPSARQSIMTVCKAARKEY